MAISLSLVPYLEKSRSTARYQIRSVLTPKEDTYLTEIGEPTVVNYRVRGLKVKRLDSFSKWLVGKKSSACASSNAAAKRTSSVHRPLEYSEHGNNRKSGWGECAAGRINRPPFIGRPIALLTLWQGKTRIMVLLSCC